MSRLALPIENYSFKPIRDRGAHGSGRTSRVLHERLIYIKTGKKTHGKGRGQSDLTIAITIGKKIIDECRWVIGDRIDILHDKQNKVIYLCRVHDGGYALSNATAEKTASCIGKAMRGVVQATITKESGFTSDVRASVNYKVTESGILIELPDWILE
jgi:hypothetical protein